MNKQGLGFMVRGLGFWVCGVGLGFNLTLRALLGPWALYLGSVLW